jgi:hypothetical protein
MLNALTLSHEFMAEALDTAFQVDPIPKNTRGVPQITLPIVHVPTGIRFRLIPGGFFEMGLTLEDLENGSVAINWTAEVARYVETAYASCLPAHSVEVKAFLCSESLLSAGDLAKLGFAENPGVFERSMALGVAQELGFRLPSEAELEWVARDGQNFCFPYNWPLTWGREDETFHEESQFGVLELCPPQWAADDWHPSYEGAPSTSLPWMDGDPRGVVRFGVAYRIGDCDDSYERKFLAARRPDPGCAVIPGVRLALDVPERLRGLQIAK